MNISLGGDETLHVELEANSVDRWPYNEQLPDGHTKSLEA